MPQAADVALSTRAPLESLEHGGSYPGPVGSRGRARVLLSPFRRLVVLFVFLTGFSTMHGFLAVSASADPHQPRTVAASEHHADAAPSNRVSPADAPPATRGAPAPPGPAEHHDLLAGCVVALVGTAVLALALLLQQDRRSWSTRSLWRAAVGVRHRVSIRVPGPPPPFAALCVIQV